MIRSPSGGSQPFAAIRDAFAEPVDPQPPVGIEHHFDDGWLGQPVRDRRAIAVRRIRALRTMASDRTASAPIAIPMLISNGSVRGDGDD
jgi:hypothetical protein